MIDEATYEQLDRYAAGKMNAGERAAFDARLSNDESLRDELAFLSAATAALAMNGKTILEKQLAEVFAAVPDAALEKYIPSLPKKSFWKKWWWAIVGFVVIAAGFAAWWLFIHKSNGREDGGDMPEQSIDQQEQQPFSQPGVPGAAPPGDSCVDSFSSGIKENSAAGILFGDQIDPKKSFENSEVVPVTSRKGIKYYDVPEAPKKQTEAKPGADTPWLGYSFSSITVAGGGSDSITKQRPMNVSFRPTDAAPTYFFTDKLILCGPYRNSDGLRFSESGNTILMTDGKPGYFVLVKGPGERALVRQTGSRQ